MSSDAIHALAGLSPQRVRSLGERAARLAALRDRLVSDVGRSEQEVSDLGLRMEKLGKVSELFRFLLDMLVEKEVKVVESVVTESLQAIFYDRHLSFEAEMNTRYNRPCVDFYLRQGDKDNPRSHRGDPLGAFGGGPSSVASLVLRILTILRKKLFPVLVLDESLMPVSESYVDNTSKFLLNLASEMAFDILLVTHKTGYLEHAKRAYMCSSVREADGTEKLSMRSFR